MYPTTSSPITPRTRAARLSWALPATLALTALTVPLQVAGQASLGPLQSWGSGPLQRLGFTHVVDGADPVSAGTVRAESWIGYSNIFEEDSTATHRLLIDLERLTTAIGVRWGVSPRLEAGGSLSFETTGGGILDSFISGWHTKLGLGNADRGDYPFGAYAQRLTDARGNVRLDVPRRTMALEGVKLFAKWRAWESPDGRKRVSLSGTARVPVENDLFPQRRADLSFMALGRASWTRWHLHAGAGGATTRASHDLDGLLKPAVFFADVAVERTLGARMSAVAQLSLESPRLQGFHYGEIDGWPINFVLGMTGRIGDRWGFEVSFQEDIPPLTPAADFTLGIGIRRSW